MGELQLTIASYPSSGLNLEREIQLIKVGLLYADKITLCSLTSSMMFSLIGFKDLDDRSLLDFLESVLPYTIKKQPNLSEMPSLFIKYRELLRKKRLSREELLAKINMDKVLNEIKMQIREIMESALEESGLNKLIPVLKSGNLDITIFGAQSTGETYMDDVLKEFVDIIGNKVINGNTYPLFDEDTAKLISAGIKEGVFKYSNSNSEKSRHIGFVSNLIQRLPTFAEASIDEIVDIRKELEKPLVRFRSAMVKYSEEIKKDVWEEEFIDYAEKIFMREIEPAVLDIEEAIKSNKYLTHFIANLINKPLVVPSTSGLGILISSLSNFPKFSSVAMGIGAITGTGIIAYNSFKDFKKGSEQIERAQLYFYYKTGKLLEK